MMLARSIIFSAAMIAAIACAQESDGPTADQSAEAEVFALDDAWVDAEINRDRQALERILHEDFLVTAVSGRTIDRATFIDNIVTKGVAPFTVLHESIHIHGDTAVVIDLSGDGKIKFTWIAIRRGGEWRAISETVSRMD